ncbi:hypothetical protein ASPWEDRAFT_38072 [Aspergillus wentii DTO 134E9]|uniref:Uncharacterized protein n=1 Tax=Aspergillus wentii DTO 134E9 TaxID=1073089 RepID=A0A1L9RNS6_ASPWE|nr:uncharacterized protein ASPWEDRAFT_38072 [Aspergillus wentii DTO 134E9]KAI9934368.1 hypothetical protein MW887_005445 [Aspergillus wentii]OJJ36487.1 hypothetical protein ASPWEDRAFT_38072 [Aspergillus wentii DTO 134E9]
MMFTSSSTNSSRDFSLPDSPVSGHPPQPQASFPPPPIRRRPVPSSTNSINPPKARRFYSSPLHEGSSDSSTPLQVYGLEQREPSIYNEKPKLLRRFSHALDDIKEDFSLQLDPRTTADKIKRRSTLMLDGWNAPSTPSAYPGSQSSFDVSSQSPERSSLSRPMSILSFDNWSPPRRLGRRLTMTFSQRRKRLNQGASISSPNLIGASTQI